MTGALRPAMLHALTVLTDEWGEPPAQVSKATLHSLARRGLIEIRDDGPGVPRRFRLKPQYHPTDENEKESPPCLPSKSS